MQRRYRIRSREEFQRVYQEGRSFANRAAVLYVLGGKAGGPRVGFAAGKKLGSAVVRNRVRRRLRAAVVALWPRVQTQALLVFIGRAAVRELPYPVLLQKVTELLARAGLLDGEQPAGPAAPVREQSGRVRGPVPRKG